MSACWGSEKNIFRIISINDDGYAAVLDEDGGIVRYINASDIKLDSAAAKEVAKCDQPLTINIGPFTPVFAE